MRRRFIPPQRAPRVRVNERIRISEVRVIDENGEQIGVLETRDALAHARERGLDLVEVSPSARPPVCRVMDYGKYKYEQSKKTRTAKKKQHSTQIKEVKLRPKIDDHDYQFKVNNARKFLGQHHKVKLTIMFRGREMARKERGFELLKRVLAELTDIGQVEHNPKLEGRNLSTVVSPLSSKGRAKTKSEDEATHAGVPAAAARPAAGGAGAGGGVRSGSRGTAAGSQSTGAAPAVRPASLKRVPARQVPARKVPAGGEAAGSREPKAAGSPEPEGAGSREPRAAGSPEPEGAAEPAGSESSES